ncbi:MAG: replication-relaxation family protein [Chloroflexota bacterium]
MQNAIHLTDRDERILVALADYRYLTLDLLSRLIGEPGSTEKATGADGKSRPKSYGFGVQGLAKRLRRLRHVDYVTLLPNPVTVRGFPFKSPPAVYGLANAAIEILAGNDPHVRQQLRAEIRNNSSLKDHTITHDLLRAYFHVALELSSKANGVALAWFRGREKGFETPDDESIEQSHIYPDSWFILRRDGRERHFALEVDMATANVAPNQSRRTSIRSKMLTYCHHKAEGFQIIWLTKAKKRPTRIRREDAMMALARELVGEAHSDFFLWLNEDDIPLHKPDTLITENLFSCAYEDDHGHALFPYLES